MALSLSSPAFAADTSPWYLGEWVGHWVFEGRDWCLGLRLKEQQVAQFGMGMGSPCIVGNITAWETTRYSVSDNTLKVNTSLSPEPQTFPLDPAEAVVLMPNGKVPMERVDAGAPLPPTPDLGGANPEDSSRYELPGRVSVSLDGGWSQVTNGERIIFMHGKREMVIFHPVPLAELGLKMLEVGKTVEAQYAFKKMDTDQKLGGFQARVFDSDLKRLSDGFSGARVFLIEACCGEALVVLAITAGPSEAAMWRNIDNLLGSMKESELAVDPGCAAPTKQIRDAMVTLTSSTWGETFRLRLVAGASDLKAELAGRVGTDGPSPADQKWADCVINTFSAADDVAKGVWQMNKGDYGDAWVEVGRFGTDQEGMLDRIARPGDACAGWVKSRFGSDTLSPITAYLAARDQMDDLDCPTNPAAEGAKRGLTED
jgi:hypothetical protein